MAAPLLMAGGSGAMGAGAAGAGAAGLGGMGAAAALAGPVGWGLLAVSAFSTVMSMGAASDQAEYERFQLRLAERQAEIDARNTLVDLQRDFRYTRGAALASLGYGAAGIGDSFLAVRTDELNLFGRDVRNARLSALAGQAPISATASRTAARADNARAMGYLSLIKLGLDGVKIGTRLAGPGGD